MKKYRITVHYNGAMFKYYYETDLKDFAEKLDSKQLLEKGFMTLEVSDEYSDNKKYIHISPQNCGHIEIAEIKL